MLWHLLAKRQTTATLCGSVLPQEPMITALMSEGTVERYCVRCMAALRVALDEAPRAADSGKESAAV
ncbi:hypothetical protein [Streptomyces sp. NPDC091268]|uniref:hypothetical protein n=1 Tax=Streptomyces sp. NPDC091268 TaxID=3365979 RepID=UPI00381D493D